MSTIDDLTEQEQRLIAADFAERVLPIFEAHYPDDDRPRKSIEAVRAYARGEITKEQLSAAGSVAWSAYDAYRNAYRAAYDAYRAASDAYRAASDADAASAYAALNAARATIDAAYAAALGATWSAAASAARAAAGAAGYAERAWQQQRIDEVVAARARP